MCLAHFSQHPLCGCILCGVVSLCSLFPAFPNKTSFSPKLVTSRHQGLNLYFNGVIYVSDDVEGCNLMPDGPGCPEVLKFLKAKRIEYTPEALEELQDKAEKGPVEIAGEKAKGKAVERSGGESAERLGGKSTGKGGGIDITNRAREMLENARSALAGKKAKSGLAEPTSASMGWD